MFKKLWRLSYDSKKANLNKTWESVQTSSFASPLHMTKDQTCSGDITVSNYLNVKEEFEFYAHVPLIESHLIQFALNGLLRRSPKNYSI